MLRGVKIEKQKVKIRTQNEKIVETICTLTKQLLVSGRNSAMYECARIICNLLLMAQSMPGI